MSNASPSEVMVYVPLAYGALVSSHQYWYLYANGPSTPASKFE